jgi:hypothetical protein
MRPLLIAALLLLTPAVSQAAETDGASALGLAAQVGAHEPALSPLGKRRLARLADGHLAASAAIRVRADRVFCRVSNVDITSVSCDLAFGRQAVSFQGAPARALMNAMGAAGIAADGAAGSMGAVIAALDCRIHPGQIAERAGGGAHCSWTEG